MTTAERILARYWCSWLGDALGRVSIWRPMRGWWSEVVRCAANDNGVRPLYGVRAAPYGATTDRPSRSGPRER